MKTKSLLVIAIAFLAAFVWGDRPAHADGGTAYICSVAHLPASADASGYWGRSGYLVVRMTTAAHCGGTQLYPNRPVIVPTIGSTGCAEPTTQRTAEELAMTATMLQQAAQSGRSANYNLWDRCAFYFELTGK